MAPNEYYTYEDRAYVTPTLSRDEQMSFVDTLRDTVGKDTAQINAQTQALGTDVPPNLGGLTGSEGYFAQRYQTTPVEAQVNTLKATAQAKALNDLMANYQNQVQNKYNQAYRSYQKRAAAASRSLSGGTPTTSPQNLSIVTNAGGGGDLNVNDGGRNGVAKKMETDAQGNLYYVYENFASPVYGYNRVPIKQISDTGALARLGGKVASGTIKTVNGKDYIYLSTGQDRDGWYEVAGSAQRVPGTGE